MEFRILGPIEAWSEGRQVRLGGIKQRALLAVLLLHRNEVVSVERLIDELWDGHPPATAVKTVQVHISQLRKALGGRYTGGDAYEILVTRSPGYVLRVGPDELDSDQFERLVEHGRRALHAGNQEQATRLLLEALSLWRGPALADFALDAFAQTESARLEEARVSTIEERIDADLVAGRHQEVVGELETLIRTHPLRERLRGQLMVALYRSDRQAEALAAYQDARRMLDEELGLEPSESLQQLERAILVHDPALGVPRSRSAAEDEPTVPVVRPPVRFARSGDIQVAFQVTGDGPVDIVLAPGTVSHLDLWWDFPPFRREIEAWSSFARLIRFDKRGTGLSDRPTDVATLEERTDDIRAVMDAVGLERAVIYGRSEGGQMACMFAAMYPERTTALITWGTMARWIQAEGHPWGLTREEYDQLLVELETNWPSEYYIRGPGGSFGDIDSETMAFMLRLFQAAASPAAAVALERMNAEVDIRDILPIIRVPTLLMCHTHDPEAPAEAVRWMARQIPGARFAEFSGKSHFVGEGENLDRVVATIQEFLTGRAAAIPSHRRLLTILFLDVVGSTERAVDLGAARWRDLLTTLFDDIERELAAFDGQEIDRPGHGLLATFDGPSRAIRYAQEAGARAARLGLKLRGGIHTGEAEVDGSRVRGVAMHTAARICALAPPGEVLVSSTVRDLAAGAGFLFDDRGFHELRGVPERRQLYAVR